MPKNAKDEFLGDSLKTNHEIVGKKLHNVEVNEEVKIDFFSANITITQDSGPVKQYIFVSFKESG